VKSNVSRGEKASALIWRVSNAERRKIVERVCRTLEKTYGRPRLGNPTEPLDDLVYIIISNKTPPDRAVRLYETLKATYESWDDVLRRGYEELERVLTPGGLVKAKAPQLWAALEHLKTDVGKCDLGGLKKMTETEVFDYLVSLPGVSTKVAKCVMMYTLDMEVLPVDSHVHRVARRLGWTSKTEPRQAHEELESLVPPKLRYAFHVDCIVHGREICRPAVPHCMRCVVRKDCSFFLQNRVTIE
jgi:endonuclease III